MKIKPMIGQFEIPGIQRIGTVETRRLVEVAVPGLEGSYHQDLGSAPVALVLEGTLAGDQARDDFLNDLRDKFTTGAPVGFVADITTATAVSQVLVSDLKVWEVAGSPDSFCYSLTLTQHTEPPPTTAGSGAGFGDLTELNAALDAEAGGLFDVAQVPDLLGSIPNFGDPTPPLKGMLGEVTSVLEGLGGVSGKLRELFG